MREDNRNMKTGLKGQHRSASQVVHLLLSSVEGVFVSIYLLGTLFLLTGLTFNFAILETIRGMLVLALIPLLFFLLPFAVYSGGMLIHYLLLSSRRDVSYRGLIRLHLIYLSLFSLFIVHWLMKIGPR